MHSLFLELFFLLLLLLLVYHRFKEGNWRQIALGQVLLSLGRPYIHPRHFLLPLVLPLDVVLPVGDYPTALQALPSQVLVSGIAHDGSLFTFALREIIIIIVDSKLRKCKQRQDTRNAAI